MLIGICICPRIFFLNLFDLVKIIKQDDLSYPLGAFFNNADSSKFVMPRLQSARYSLKSNFRGREFIFCGESYAD